MASHVVDSEQLERDLAELLEVEKFTPLDEFRQQALMKDMTLHAEAERNLEGFWAGQADELLDWFAEPERTLDDSNPPFYKWFEGGKVNASYNCLDRHVEAGKGEKVAFHWRGEEGEERDITYAELHRDVKRFASALRDRGIGKGDVVGIYLPMVPELPVAMLACARIGAPHNVVFGGFSPDAVRERMEFSDAKALVTIDGARRKGKTAPIKQALDEKLADLSTIETVFVVQHTGAECEMQDGRDVWFGDALDAASEACEPEELDSEHPLYVLYTSGSTAKPKGVLHTTAGYLLGATFTHRYVFDLKPDSDVFWCAADVGWVTGHSYIVYGPLSNGATSVMYEGAPDYPDKDIWWEIVERYGVDILYTAPTAIRSHMKWGTEHAEKHDLSSIRLLGSVGEPINPEAWLWYHDTIGGGRCPIVDTWWMTETGMILITPLPGITTTKPGSATFPFPGVGADVVDEDGKTVPLGGAGYLTITKPWPAMLRGIYKDDKRYRETYWSRFPGKYFAGDGARRDKDGYFWLMGRVDDVMKISGHRISTTEVESALVSHPAVAEAAVIGREDPVTTQAIFAFVTLRGGKPGDESLSKELREHVVKAIGSIARPKTIMFTPELPKTRSGKIMWRLLRDIANGQPLGDTTTLADATVVESIRTGSASGKED